MKWQRGSNDSYKIYSFMKTKPQILISFGSFLHPNFQLFGRIFMYYALF